jgi:hypothetical protein
MRSINLKKIPQKHLLLFLLVFSLGIRLLYLNDGLFHHDSVRLAQAVEESYETRSLKGQINGRYGSVLVNLLVYAPLRFLKLVSNAEKTVILTNALFASLSVLLLYLFLVKIFENTFIPFSTALLFSVSPVFLSISTRGKPHGIETFFILASFLFVASFHKKKRPILLALSSFAIAFSVLVRESAIIFIPLYIFFYLKPEIRSGGLSLKKGVLEKRNIFALVLPLVIVLGLGMYYYLYDVLYKTLFQRSTGIVSFEGVYSESLPYAIADLNFNLNKFYLLFFIIWASTLFYFGNTTGYAPRFLATVSIPFFLFIALTLNWIYEKNRPAGTVLLIFLALSMFIRIHPIIEYRHGFSGEKEYALWLREQVPPDSLIIALDDLPFIEYYSGLWAEDRPIGDLEEIENWVERIKGLLENGTPIYMVESAFFYDPEGVFRDTVFQNFHITVVGYHPNEDYHKATISFNKYEAGLYRVQAKDIKSTAAKQVH